MRDRGETEAEDELKDTEFVGKGRQVFNTVLRTKKRGRPKKVKVQPVVLNCTEPTWEGLGIPLLYWPGIELPVAAVYGVEGSWAAELRLPSTAPVMTGTTFAVREDCQKATVERVAKYLAKRKAA